MQIKIEIDVKPEELRRFLGLPDVAGLQEDLVQFIRDKVTAASETFDPAAFVRANVEGLKKSPRLQRIWLGAAARVNAAAQAAAEAAAEAGDDLAQSVKEATHSPAPKSPGRRTAKAQTQRPRKPRSATSRARPGVDKVNGG